MIAGGIVRMFHLKRRKKSKWEKAREEMRSEGLSESEIDDIESAQGDIEYDSWKDRQCEEEE